MGVHPPPIPEEGPGLRHREGGGRQGQHQAAPHQQPQRHRLPAGQRRPLQPPVEEEGQRGAGCLLRPPPRVVCGPLGEGVCGKIINTKKTQMPFVSPFLTSSCSFLGREIRFVAKQSPKPTFWIPSFWAFSKILPLCTCKPSAWLGPRPHPTGGVF